MREFRSFLAPQILQFIRYKLASQCWSNSSEKNLAYFDRYCRENYPEADTLTQEMVDGWCRKRDTENSASCGTRISSVRSFISFLNARGLSVYDTLPVWPVYGNQMPVPVVMVSVVALHIQRKPQCIAV